MDGSERTYVRFYGEKEGEGLDFGSAVSRVLSAPLPGERIICLSDPTRNPVPRDAERATPGSPIWSCTRWGLPCLRDCSWSGGLLPHLFTLTLLRRGFGGRFVFCGAFRRDASRRRLPRVSRAVPGLRGIVPCGVRTFLPRAAEACGSDSPPIRNRGAELSADPGGWQMRDARCEMRDAGCEIWGAGCGVRGARRWALGVAEGRFPSLQFTVALRMLRGFPAAPIFRKKFSTRANLSCQQERGS